MLSFISARGQSPALMRLGAVVLLALTLTLLPTTTAIAFVGGVFLCLALLRWHATALYLLVFAIPFGSLLPLPIGGANVTAADGLIVLALMLWLLRQIARRQIVVRVDALVVVFVIFILTASVSLTTALSFQAGVKELAKWVELLAAYWLLAQEFTPRQVERLLAAIFLAGLAEAALGIYQYYFRAGPEGFLLFGGSNLRAFGTFEQPNPYAGYLGLIIPLAFGAVLGILSDRASHYAHRLALGALAALALGALLAALFFSFSRGAWLGVGAALFVTALMRSQRAALFALAVALALAFGALLGPPNVIPDVVSERFSTVGDYLRFQDVRGVKVNDANFAIVERMAHWQAAWQMFDAHPALGVGIGNYAVVYPAYSLPRWDDPLGHAHNYYLNVLAETGLSGFVVYVLLWGALLGMAWRAARTTTGFWQGVAAGACGVLIALSIHNLFDNLFVHSMHIQVGITLGIVASLQSSRRTRLVTCDL